MNLVKKSLLLIYIVLACVSASAQVQFEWKSEYLGKSGYRIMEGEKSQPIGDSKGAAQVHQATLSIPLSLKPDERQRPTLWSIGAQGVYSKLDNQNFTEPLVIDEIVNLGVSLNHMRPIAPRWSMLATVGAGVYTPSSNLSQLNRKNILGMAGAVFIYHLRSNLDLGGGVAFNNSFGAPMVLPAIYLNWRTGGNFKVNIAMMDGLAMSVRYDAHKNISLSIVGEMNGQMALLEQDGQDKIFSHMYVVTGLRPEIKLGKKLSIPITLGINAFRPAEMTDRSIKNMFTSEGYYFQASPYASAGFKLKI